MSLRKADTKERFSAGVRKPSKNEHDSQTKRKISMIFRSRWHRFCGHSSLLVGLWNWSIAWLNEQIGNPRSNEPRRFNRADFDEESEDSPFRWLRRHSSARRNWNCISIMCYSALKLSLPRFTVRRARLFYSLSVKTTRLLGHLRRSEYIFTCLKAVEAWPSELSSQHETLPTHTSPISRDGGCHVIQNAFVSSQKRHTRLDVTGVPFQEIEMASGLIDTCCVSWNSDESPTASRLKKLSTLNLQRETEGIRIQWSIIIRSLNSRYAIPEAESLSSSGFSGNAFDNVVERVHERDPLASIGEEHYCFDLREVESFFRHRNRNHRRMLSEDFTIPIHLSPPTHTVESLFSGYT